jgi:carbonic anhydrase
VAGQHFPLEAHLVHKHAASGNIVVVGILFETGSENAFLQHFIQDLPEEKDDHFFSTSLVNVHELLPVDQRYYTYARSLTTPPCSETVSWIVLKTPVGISSTQLQRFTNILHNNYRPLQALLGREIRESI